MADPGRTIEADRTVGQRIRAARLHQQLSVFRASARAGINPAHWSRVEAGANATLITAGRMAAAVGLQDLEQLLDCCGRPGASSAPQMAAVPETRAEPGDSFRQRRAGSPAL